MFEAFKITERKEEVKEEAGKDAPKPSNKLTEKVQDQFAADEEAVEVCDYLLLLKLPHCMSTPYFMTKNRFFFPNI